VLDPLHQRLVHAAERLGECVSLLAQLISDLYEPIEIPS
jgi:hypothetical protein